MIHSMNVCEGTIRDTMKRAKESLLTPTDTTYYIKRETYMKNNKEKTKEIAYRRCHKKTKYTYCKEHNSSNTINIHTLMKEGECINPKKETIQFEDVSVHIVYTVTLTKELKQQIEKHLSSSSFSEEEVPTYIKKWANGNRYHSRLEYVTLGKEVNAIRFYPRGSNETFYYDDKTKIIFEKGKKPLILGRRIKVEHNDSSLYWGHINYAMVKEIVYFKYIFQEDIWNHCVYFKNSDNLWIYVGKMKNGKIHFEKYIF